MLLSHLVIVGKKFLLTRDFPEILHFHAVGGWDLLHESIGAYLHFAFGSVVAVGMHNIGERVLTSDKVCISKSLSLPENIKSRHNCFLSSSHAT